MKLCEYHSEDKNGKAGIDDSPLYSRALLICGTFTFTFVKPFTVFQTFIFTVLQTFTVFSTFTFTAFQTCRSFSKTNFHFGYPFTSTVFPNIHFQAISTTWHPQGRCSQLCFEKRLNLRTSAVETQDAVEQV